MWMDYLANAVIYYFSRIPLLGKLVGKASYRQRQTMHVCSVLGMLCRLIWACIKAAFSVGLFVFLPRLLFVHFMPTGADGFGLDNSFVYFTLVMICFGGSLNHSRLFDVTEKSVSCLKTIKMKPKTFFHFLLIENLSMEFVAYWIALFAFGMHWYKAFYLAILVLLARFIGETIQIQVFRISGKRLADIKGGVIFVSLLALFCAYFIPYIRNCVPSAYNLIFQTIFFMVILVLASFFIYYVWNYDSYDEIAHIVHTRHYLMRAMGEPMPKVEPVSATHVTKREKKQSMRRHERGLRGYRYHNWLFFKRNGEKIRRYIYIRIVIVLIATVIAVISNLMGYGKMVYKVIVSSIPITVFIMYVMTISGSLCKAFFSQSDRYLLNYGYFRRTEDILEHYTARLRVTTAINLVPTLAVIGGYVLSAWTTGLDDVFWGTFYVSMTVLVYGMMFSVIHLTVYYLAQPYNQKVEVKNPWFVVTTLLILGACYGCIYINTLPIYFLLASALLLGVVLAVSGTLVWKFAPRLFRVYRNK